MFTTLFTLLVITFCGTILTSYFNGKKENLLVRIASGNVAGSAIFGLIAFIGACLFGLSLNIIIISLIILSLTVILLKNKELRNSLKPDFSTLNYTSLIYYSAFLVLFYLFFERAMIETKDGIFTGASQNLGDLPYHLGAITSFTEGNNFPPENPSFAGAKFTYPFIADFITACFVKLGADIKNAMLWQNITLAFSLLVLLINFTAKFTNNKLAGKIAPMLLFFSGGLGFLWFAKDYWHDGRGFFEFIWNLKSDYTIRIEGFRFGNSLTTLFVTQRSLLFGMPITLLVLTYLWELFSNSSQQSAVSSQPNNLNSKSLIHTFAIGILAGTLPLIHLHSLIVLFIVSALLFVFDLSKWREWIAFGFGVCLIAVPELIFALSGTSNRTSEFFGWHFGWDKGNENIIVFYVKSLGLFIPFLVFVIFVFYSQRKNSDDDSTNVSSQLTINNYLFYLPFLFCFIIANVLKLAPWEWDNIKVLIYWFVGSIPFVALAIAMLWEGKTIYKPLAVFCLLCLTLAGMVDVFRVLSKTINYQVFDKDALAIAEKIKQQLPPKALILNAPTYNSAIVLTGRRSLMRYTGHLSSHGIDYSEREKDVKTIYNGDAVADILLKKYNIEYVLVSPMELNDLDANEAYFEKFPLVCESGQYKLYSVVSGK